MGDEKAKPEIKKDWWKGSKAELGDEFFEKGNDIIDQIEKKLGTTLGGATAGSVDKIKVLENLIKHYVDLSKTLDTRRADYFKAALQVLAIAVTGLGVIIKFIEPKVSIILFVAISVSLALISLILFSILIMNKYYWQTKSDRYHFLKINSAKHPYLGNSWMWFYHGIPSIGGINFNPVKDKKAEEDNRKGALSYLEGANYFYDNFISADEKEIYRQNLRHTYLLLVHNAYKNKFERQLTDLWSKATSVTTLILVGSLLVLCVGGWIFGAPFKPADDPSKVTVANDSLLVSFKSPTPASFKFKVDSVNIATAVTNIKPSQSSGTKVSGQAKTSPTSKNGGKK